MQLDPRLLEILACPQCHAPLRADDAARGARLHVGRLRAGLPGARRHPGAARRRGPPPRPEPTYRAGRRPSTTRSSTTRTRSSRLDPGEMLRAVATAGAQVRESLVRVEDAALAAVVADGRPRAVVVTGMGGSGIAADVRRRGRRPDLPGAGGGPPRRTGCPAGSARWTWSWRCPAPARTEETLSATGRGAAPRRSARDRRRGRVPAGRRGRQQARAVHLPGRRARAGCRGPTCGAWPSPVLLVLDALGLADVPRGDARRARRPAGRGRPSAAARLGRAYENPAKRLALQLAGSLPYVWGASDLASVAASRSAAQLAENAKYPAVHGALTEVHHNQVVVMAGRVR